MLELKELSVDDGLDIYHMLQEIPREENGLLNKANVFTRHKYLVVENLNFAGGSYAGKK